MSYLGSIALGLDRLGLRRAIAPVASVLRRLRTGGRQSFSVSPEGYWMNRDGTSVIVSPDVHTAPYEAYEHWVLDNWAWDYQPKPGDTIIDIGAGVGEEALIFSQLVGPTGRVVSVEAHPRTFDCLSRTITESRLFNVEPRWCAISDADGTVQIEDAPSYIGNSIMRASKSTIDVPAKSIDSLLAELQIERVDLLRMNIEGAERLAVDGMTRSSALCRHIVVSCHDFIADFGGSEQLRTYYDVKDKLQALGFHLRERPDYPSCWARYYVYGSRKAAARQ